MWVKDLAERGEWMTGRGVRKYRLLIVLILFGSMIVVADRPNVLFILTDDQGYGDLSLHGNPVLKTPHIDSIGEDGVRFDRFYVNSVCAPSRASILTGRYAVRTGVYSVTRNGETIKPDEVTIAEALKAADYRTGYFGKWHNGGQYPSIPTGQGFDESFGFNAGHINNYFDATLLRNTTPEKTKGYITDVLTDEAIRFVEKDTKEPFFCFLSYNAPHGPYQVPDEYLKQFKGKHANGRNGRKLNVKAAATWAMCKNIDDNVGRVLKRLEELGLAENTIVLFLTDNGGIGGVQFYNAGMRGGKTSTHEGGSRVPLFIRWPQAKWKPHVVEELTAHIDLYLTLLDLCGVTAPKEPRVDGRSLRPLIEQSNTMWAERNIYLHNGIDEINRYPGAVRTPRYRLVCDIPGPRAGSGAKNLDGKVSPWKLYDMIKDPGERRNLANIKPEIVEQLSKQYESWIDDTFRDGRRRLPLPVGHAEHNPVSLHASQCFFDAPVRYHVRGFAHDWMTGWTSEKGKIWFDVDVAEAGEYEITITYGCSKRDAGSTIRVSTQSASCSTTVVAAEAPLITLPHLTKCHYFDREWGELKVGTLSLDKGRTNLTIEATKVAGRQVMDFKSITLERRP